MYRLEARVNGDSWTLVLERPTALQLIDESKQEVAGGKTLRVTYLGRVLWGWKDGRWVGKGDEHVKD